MKRLFRDFWWKILSLLIAFILWFSLIGDQERATTIAVPVEMKGIPPELEISSDAPDRVTLEVQGPASKVRDLSASRVSVILDLSDVTRPGQRTFTVDPSNVFLPAGVRLNRAIPGQVRIHFEQRIQKDIPIRIHYAAPPPKGYRILSATVIPDYARIEGPEARVRRVLEAETDPIDLSTVVAPTEYRVNLYVNDPFVRLTSATNVRLRVEVRSESETVTTEEDEKAPSEAAPAKQKPKSGTKR